MGQGYIDQILFTQGNNALLSQANDYRNEIEALNRSQSLDATKVYETERLLHFCERGEMQLEYSEELFELFVDHIEVYSRQKIGFALHCGLILKEMTSTRPSLIRHPLMPSVQSLASALRSSDGTTATLHQS